MRNKEKNQGSKQTNLVDISTKSFEPSTAASKYNELYQDVWTQIATIWADPAITTADVEHDTEMDVIIYNYRDDTPALPTSQEDLGHFPHKITIEVKADDLYFKAQDETEYWIDVDY